MSVKFRKPSAKRQQPIRKKKPQRSPKLPPKGDATKTPVTRVPDGKDHQDKLATKVLYVLVDDPKARQDSVTLERAPQVLPMLFTTDAEDLKDTTLVSILTFEHVKDGGKFTLKLTQGESTAELFTDIPSESLFGDNPDFVFGPQPEPGEDDRSNLRLLDYHTLPDHPSPDDEVLGWIEMPLVTISEKGS
jgi:hypothetical protein